MTLLEILLAITLLSIIAAASTTWIIHCTRLGVQARDRLAAYRSAIACRMAITDDLALAIPDPTGVPWSLKDGVLSMNTLDSQPGGDHRLHIIQWRFNPDGAQLVRVIDNKATVVVSQRLAGAGFQALGHQLIFDVRMRADDEQTQRFLLRVPER